MHRLRRLLPHRLPGDIDRRRKEREGSSEIANRSRVCTGCSLCFQVCPSEAIVEKSLKK